MSVIGNNQKDTASKERIAIGNICLELEQDVVLEIKVEGYVQVDERRRWLGVKPNGILSDYTRVETYTCFLGEALDTPGNRKEIIKQIETTYKPDSNGVRFYVYVRIPDPKGKKKKGVLQMIYPDNKQKTGVQTNNNI